MHTLVAIKRVQLLDYRLPQDRVIPYQWRRQCERVDRCSVGCEGVGFRLFLLLLCGILHSVTVIAELNRCRRHAGLIIAGSKLQESLDVILIPGDFVSLGESDIVLEVA